MKAVYTILLLIVSNIFMTFAWYGHLKLQEMKVISNWPLYAVILFSWAIALAEYSFQVPANRIGFVENGGPFSLMQLKVIQEVITLMIVTLFTSHHRGHGVTRSLFFSPLLTTDYTDWHRVMGLILCVTLCPPAVWVLDPASSAG